MSFMDVMNMPFWYWLKAVAWLVLLIAALMGMFTGYEMQNQRQQDKPSLKLKFQLNPWLYNRILFSLLILMSLLALALNVWLALNILKNYGNSAELSVIIIFLIQIWLIRTKQRIEAGDITG